MDTWPLRPRRSHLDGSGIPVHTIRYRYQCTQYGTGTVALTDSHTATLTLYRSPYKHVGRPSYTHVDRPHTATLAYIPLHSHVPTWDRGREAPFSVAELRGHLEPARLPHAAQAGRAGNGRMVRGAEWAGRGREGKGWGAGMQ